MRQALSVLFTVAVFFPFAGSIMAVEKPADSTIIWKKWSPAVFARAQQEQKLVLLDLTASWCQWCKKMDATTYRDPAVIERINRDYIPVRADRDDYPKLAQRYQNYGPPATVVFNSAGTEVIKRRGYLQSQLMQWMLDAVAANPAPEAHQ